LKKEVLSEQNYEDGINIWSLGYKDEWEYLGQQDYYDNEAQTGFEDFDEEEDAGAEAFVNPLVDRMRDDDIVMSENYSKKELELIDDRTDLTYAYENRWFRYKSPDQFIIGINRSVDTIKPGD
jgi:hypothetical protein